MVKVKIFAADEGDAGNMATALQDELDSWIRENPHFEIVSCQAALAYNPDETSLYGIMTVTYRDHEPPKED